MLNEKQSSLKLKDKHASLKTDSEKVWLPWWVRFFLVFFYMMENQIQRIRMRLSAFISKQRRQTIFYEPFFPFGAKSFSKISVDCLHFVS